MDRSRLALAAAVPSAVGYLIPLLAGLATGHAADGVTASAGALIVGFANLGGRYWIRSATLLATTTTTTAVGAAALAGGLAGPGSLATVLLMGLWGFAGGLMVSFGTRGAFVGMLSTWALLLAGDLNLHGQAVLHEAALITAGGLVQTVLAVAAWPLRPFGAERRAVADAYRALAAGARAPGTAAFQDTAAALAAAAETVGEGPPRTGEHGTLRALVEQGEWIRLELAALARRDAAQPDTTRSDATGAAAVMSEAAAVLDAIAEGHATQDALAGLTRSIQAIGDPAAPAAGGKSAPAGSPPPRTTAGLERPARQAVRIRSTRYGPSSR